MSGKKIFFVITPLLGAVAVILFANENAVKPHLIPKWGYKTDRNCDEKSLNDLGSQGWELVSVGLTTPTTAHGSIDTRNGQGAIGFDLQGGNVCVAYFKRPL